ncbi:MAG: hypothetical protein K2X66_00350 [Cyanobacteria bacterium]|nr:hypothetical protein [Cyanobacteriota bacterium]
MNLLSLYQKQSRHLFPQLLMGAFLLGAFIFNPLNSGAEERWTQVFETPDGNTFLDQHSVHRCGINPFGFFNSQCNTVTRGYFFWKKWVPKSASLLPRLSSGVLDCRNQEINFMPIRPESEDEAIYQSLCHSKTKSK